VHASPRVGVWHARWHRAEPCGSLRAVRVLVTGAGGFVGRVLLPRLTAAGWIPVGRDLDLDVTDAQATEASVAQIAPDGIVHLAAQSSVAQSLDDADQTFHVNFIGARNVLDAVVRRAPRCRVLLVGSGDEYGSARGTAAPVSEQAPLRPGSPYARTKACADLLGAVYAQRGVDVIRARPFNHTGPGQRDSFVVASFARQIAEIELGRRPSRIRVGNLESVRDFLDVEDVVNAYALLLERRVPAGVYNVASGHGVSIEGLLEQLLAHSTARPRIEVDPARHRPTDCLVGDAGRLRTATGWAPSIPLSRTLARTLEDWRLRLRAA
jgi:GDP-4-dehydro-6-deoxy-D-mannose reductase